MILHMKKAIGGLITTMVLSLYLFASCASYAPVLGMTVKSLNWNPGNPLFRTYYGWEEKAGSWNMELIPAIGGGSIAIHVFRPPLLQLEAGTVFLLHGYLDHSALRVQPALEFVKKGWIVVGMDLPGHGLSSGKRADIDDFSEYLAAFDATMAAHLWPKPWRAVGHSTGGATISMAMQNPACTFDLVVLESTLIRTYMWTPMLWLRNITEDWIFSVNRRTGTYNKEDPYRIDTVPLHWLDAVKAYYQSTLDWIPVKGRVLILQGNDDTVVDAKYNIPFLKDIFPDAEIVEIAGGKHHLLVDAGPAGEAARQELSSRW